MTRYDYNSLGALENTERKSMQLLTNLRKKIETLQKEKAGLLAEVESLSKRGEMKARELKSEVTMLRKEVKALERLLDVKESNRAIA